MAGCLRCLPFVLLGFMIPYGNPSWSEETNAELVKIYSNVCLHEETGGLLGDEIVVFHAQERDYVLLHTAEGVFLKPVLNVASIQGNNIKFGTDDVSDVRSFSGKISPESIVGSFRDGRTDRTGNVVMKFMRRSTKHEPLQDCN